jgi:Rhomboid family
MHAGIGANLISATFESSCTLLVGASGAVFGFMGLFVADLVVNFESISWPILRVLCILLFVVFFVLNTLSEDSNARVSHASHIGGAVCGLFPSLLFLPNIRNKRIRALKRQIGTGEGPASGANLQYAPLPTLTCPVGFLSCLLKWPFMSSDRLTAFSSKKCGCSLCLAHT